MKRLLLLLFVIIVCAARGQDVPNYNPVSTSRLTTPAVRLLTGKIAASGYLSNQAGHLYWGLMRIDTNYSGSSHSHYLDSLSNVNTLGKGLYSILYWDPTTSKWRDTILSSSTYQAGYGLGLSGSTFFNSRYWKYQDTVKTSLNGILKATSGVLSAASAGNDYQAPVSAGYRIGITGTTINNTLYQKSIDTINTALSTGLVKVTNGTGKLSTAVAGTDYLVSNQNITLSGDVTGTGATTISTTVADNAVDGTDISLASEAAGDIMYFNGTDWVRLAKNSTGYKYLYSSDGNPSWQTAVSSVGLLATGIPQILVTGSPITTNGSFGLSWQDTLPNKVLAGPASGGAGKPRFRSLVTADIPDLSGSYSTTSHNHTLDGLSNVLTTGKADKNVIYWDNSTAKWRDTTAFSAADTGKVNTTGTESMYGTYTINSPGAWLQTNAGNINFTSTAGNFNWGTTDGTISIDANGATQHLILSSEDDVLIYCGAGKYLTLGVQSNPVNIINTGTTINSVNGIDSLGKYNDHVAFGYFDKLMINSGSSSFTTPTTRGNSGEFLKSNGDGTTTWGAIGGSGTVTNVATGLGLSGGPITTTGTVSLDTASAVVLSRTRASHEYQPKGNYLTSEVDGSTTNEIQNLSYTPSTRSLGISGGGTGTTLPEFSTSSTDAGLVPGSNSAGSTYYLRADKTWAVPPDNNTTYSAGYGMGLTGTTFYNSRYWKGQDTVKTTLNGLLKATSGVLSAAVAGTDYQAPLTTGNLTENITGLEFDNTRQVIGGTATLSLTSGYVIPTTTEQTNWGSAYTHSTSSHVSTGAKVWTSQAESSLSAEENIGGLTTGLMKATVTGGVATASTITDNSSNWNTAYGWGNHASAGYVTSASEADNRLAIFTATDAIEGDADLTFDGHALTISGRQSITNTTDGETTLALSKSYSTSSSGSALYATHSGTDNANTNYAIQASSIGGSFSTAIGGTGKYVGVSGTTTDVLSFAGVSGDVTYGYGLYGKSVNGNAIYGQSELYRAGAFFQINTGTNPSSEAFEIGRAIGGSANLTRDMLTINESSSTSGSIGGNLIKCTTGAGTQMTLDMSGNQAINGDFTLTGGGTLTSTSNGIINVDPNGSGGIRMDSTQFTNQVYYDAIPSNAAAASTTINWKTGNLQIVTLGADITTLAFTAPSGPAHLTMKIVHAANTTTYAIDWTDVPIKWPGGTAPTLTQTSSSVDIITFFYDGSTWYGMAGLNFQ
ncbi:MAG TPA: hypothetical protein P5531_10500 [Bacteroidales bacterium]|nr:hypothetical protein [Bacteroidales bacterium]HSA43608.1 hypothetical protein [Bacteroidales bacterium]